MHNSDVHTEPILFSVACNMQRRQSKMRSLRTSGATRVQAYRARQTQLDEIFTHIAGSLALNTLKSELGLHHRKQDSFNKQMITHRQHKQQQTHSYPTTTLVSATKCITVTIIILTTYLKSMSSVFLCRLLRYKLTFFHVTSGLPLGLIPPSHNPYTFSTTRSQHFLQTKYTHYLHFPDYLRNHLQDGNLSWFN